MPARRQRPGLGLAVADDAGDDEVRVVEGRAIGVRQRVAEFAALVDRARRLRRDMARNAAGERELVEEPLHPLLVLRHVGIDLAVGSLEIGVGDQPRAAVAGAGDVDHVEVELLDQPVEMGVDEVQAGRRAPVAEQARLDVLLATAASSAADCRTDRSARRTDSSPRASRRRSERSSFSDKTFAIAFLPVQSVGARPSVRFAQCRFRLPPVSAFRRGDLLLARNQWSSSRPCGWPSSSHIS